MSASTIQLDFTEDLIQYISAGSSAFHAARESARRLNAQGAIELQEDERWELKPDALYYLLRDQGALVAFSTGGRAWQAEGEGIRVAAAHLDSPLLKLKGPSLVSEAGMLLAGIEVYGGPIFSTWFDRELSICGRYVRSRSASEPASQDQTLEAGVFTLNGMKAIIANAAIHMNKEINKGHVYNPQSEMRAIVFPRGTKQPNADLRYYLALQLGCKPEDILDMDAFLVPDQRAEVAGEGQGEYIFSGRIDNLAGCHAALQGFLADWHDARRGDDSDKRAPRFVCLYNHEEIGSMTHGGADSAFFPRIFHRVLNALGGAENDIHLAQQKAFQVSIDATHGLHPNYTQKHDSEFQPLLGKGPVIKRSATHKYGTEALTASRLINLARSEGIELQDMVNRADLPSGRSIGPMSMSMSDLATVDIGIPILAMHSSRELASVADQRTMLELLSAFYRRGVRPVRYVSDDER